MTGTDAVTGLCAGHIGTGVGAGTGARAGYIMTGARAKYIVTGARATCWIYNDWCMC